MGLHHDSCHIAPLGAKPSHDLETDDPCNLCHLVFQEQEVARVMECAAEAYRTLRDVHCDCGSLEALMIFDQSADMSYNLCVLDRETRDHTNVVVDLDHSWRPPDHVLIQHLLTIQRDCARQDDLPAPPRTSTGAIVMPRTPVDTGGDLLCS